MPFLPPQQKPHRYPPVRAHRSGLVRVIALTVGALLLLTGLYWWNLISSSDQLRRETLNQAQLRAAQVNSAAAEVISMLFLNIELTTLQLIDDYEQDPGPAFNQKVAQITRQLPAGAVLQVGVITQKIGFSAIVLTFMLPAMLLVVLTFLDIKARHRAKKAAP